MKIITCLLSIVLFLFTSCTKEKEKPFKPLFEIDPYAKIPEFDAGYAYAQVEKQVSFGPRNPNSKGHSEALNYLFNELKKYTGNVELQSFIYSWYDNEKLNLINIIAKFNPEKKDRIILCAHWDTRPRAEKDKKPENRDKPILGANDGGSGVAVLLEIARLLKEDNINYGIDLLLFDGEDYGKSNDLSSYSLGAKYFSANLPQNYQPVFALLLDMVGDKEAYFPIEGNSKLYAPDLVNLIWNAAEQVQSDKFVLKEANPIYDDHIALNEAGIRTVDIIDHDLIGADSQIERRNYWHTLNDTMENIDSETLMQVGRVLTYIIWGIRFNNI